jgi:hypothetical protein
VAVVERLLRHNSNPAFLNIEDEAGVTAIMRANRSRHTDVVDALAAAGASREGLSDSDPGSDGDDSESGTSVTVSLGDAFDLADSVATLERLCRRRGQLRLDATRITVSDANTPAYGDGPTRAWIDDLAKALLDPTSGIVVSSELASPALGAGVLLAYTRRTWLIGHPPPSLSHCERAILAV